MKYGSTLLKFFSIVAIKQMNKSQLNQIFCKAVLIWHLMVLAMYFSQPYHSQLFEYNEAMHDKKFQEVIRAMFIVTYCFLIMHTSVVYKDPHGYLLIALYASYPKYKKTRTEHCPIPFCITYSRGLYRKS